MGHDLAVVDTYEVIGDRQRKQFGFVLEHRVDEELEPVIRLLTQRVGVGELAGFQRPGVELKARGVAHHGAVFEHPPQGGLVHRSAVAPACRKRLLLDVIAERSLGVLRGELGLHRFLVIPCSGP